MRVLFVENRYKTALWEIIGHELEKEGHEVYFLVQNHMFKPSMENVKLLPYPKKLTKPKVYTPEIKKIIQADRGLNYFGIKSDDFIFWYEDKIEAIIDEINPDLVFGESTLFHELLVIKSCKKRDIRYLHPSSCRYPKNRFSFYNYDTLTPFGFSNDKLSIEDAKETAHAIGKRLALPDYMNVSKTAISNFDFLKDKARLTLGYYLGEKYNTPSPLKKRKINSYYQKQIHEWEKFAVGVEDLKDQFYILYPMQMQPEANIDVWGYPNNDQAKVVARVLADLGENEKLVIKPNPKSKYEISSGLLKLVKENPGKIIALNHASNMKELWPYIDLVVTVTGTISIECIFDNKPVVMLGQGIQTSQDNCVYLDQNESIKPVINSVKKGSFPILSEDKKVDFLQELMATSFRGINGDGLHNKGYMEDEANLAFLKESFKKIILNV
ncbi:hypothetical protein [Christiangramia aquimixticola]|uniref:capsular polysaccharide export protein, LipB/KpsS family n=1 Tax=Christiangramia aquimixticola TaxID=1697558 RepID=UPI003AA7CEBC